MISLLAWAVACGDRDPSDPDGSTPNAPTGETGRPSTDTGQDTAPPPIDADGDGWPADQDCDDADPDRFPGAPETYGDGVDSDCDGWDALPLADAVGVTAQLDDPTWLQLGHDLDVGDIDGDGDAEVFAGSQDLNKFTPENGMAAVFDGPALTQRATWEGDYNLLTFEYDYGRGVGILEHDAGTQLAFLSLFGVWVIDGSATSSPAPPLGALYIANEAEYNHGVRLAAVDTIGDTDEDVVLECSDDAFGGNVCVVEGPVTADRSLSDADLIVSGGDGLGSGLGGADLDADGRSDLILGASNAQDNRGEISVLFGPVPTGRADTADADASWIGENPGDWLGQVVASGDLDHDGVDEVIGSAMASPFNDRNGRVYGLPLSAGVVQDSTFAVDGDALQHLGMGLDAGDLDGDGLDDLAIGGPSSPIDPSVPGRTFVFFGPVAGALATSDADVAYVGEAPGDGAGVSVGIGDVDGDGVGDLVIAAPLNDEAQLLSGKLYLLPGPLGP